MKHRIFAFLIILSLYSCSNSKDEDSNQSKSLVELMNEQAEATVIEMEESKGKLEDLSEEELLDLVTNPKEEDREFLVEFLSIIDTETFIFEPLKEGEKLDFEKIYHLYYKDSNDKISTNEIILYRSSANGDRTEIKTFWRAGSIIEDPENTPGHFFFYIKDDRNSYNQYLWEVDESNGVGRVISSEWGFVSVSNDSKYIIRQLFLEHIYNEEKFDFPVLSVYSISEMEKVKEYDIFSALANELKISYLLEESYAFHVSSLDGEFAADLAFMGDTVIEFRIDQSTLELTRVE